MPSTPDVVPRNYAAAESGDLDAVLQCFTTDAHVHDVPGGAIDLKQRCAVSGGLISDLEI